jgi:putative redox protein
MSVLLLHGFPSADVWADKIGCDMGELCERIARDHQWNALTMRFRGCGQSTGEFSLARWVDDASAAIRYLKAETKPDGLWVCGFGTGGAVGLVAAADDPDVTGAAVAGSPADFDDWAAAPDRLLRHAREVGVIKGSSFPPNVQRWNQELREVKAVEAAEQFSPRPLLVLHGSQDEAVPHFDARLVADAHGSADLRFINGGGHQLRHDPRAVAVLMGWLDRQAATLAEG